MTTRLPAQCLACVHLLTPGMAARCRAYPGGIPWEIGMLCQDHRTPRGDEVDGLVFKQADGEQAAAAFAWWQRMADQMTRR